MATDMDTETIEVPPASVGVVVTPGLSIALDAKLTVDDLADAVIGDDEEDMLFEKDGIEKKLTGLRSQHGKLGEKLVKLGQKHAKAKAVTPLAKKLATALSQFTGEDHMAELSEGSIDIEKGEVTVDMQIWNEKKKERAHYSTPAHTKREVFKFPADMKLAVKQIKEKATEITECDESLIDVRKRLADVPHRIKRAKRGLVKALASGQITDGRSVIAALSTAQPKALPVLTHQ